MFALRVNQVHWTHFENSVDHAAQLRDLVLCEEAGKGESGRETTLTSPRCHSGRFHQDVSFEHGVGDVPESVNERIRGDDLCHVFSIRHWV